jgi:hypothetical protein
VLREIATTQMLDYATQNRMEWKRKGADIVKSWKEESRF